MSQVEQVPKTSASEWLFIETLCRLIQAVRAHQTASSVSLAHKSGFAKGAKDRAAKEQH